MAIGSIIGAVAGGIGSAFGGASNNSKAINKATDATLQANQQNIDLYKQIYGENKQTLSPFVNAGTQATGAINALLGLTPTNAPSPVVPSAATGTPGSAMSFNPITDQGGFAGIRDKWAQIIAGRAGMNGQQQATAQPATQQASYLTPQQAFQNYQNSTGYQFRLNQGMNALNSGYAGAGSIKSGAAMKSAMDYGQGIASQEFNNYLNALGNQQGVGLSAAGAQAGVSTNYANNIANTNSNSANMIGQAAIAKANNSNALMSGILKSVGTIAGGF